MSGAAGRGARPGLRVGGAGTPGAGQGGGHGHRLQWVPSTTVSRPALPHQLSPVDAVAARPPPRPWAPGSPFAVILLFACGSSPQRGPCERRGSCRDQHVAPPPHYQPAEPPPVGGELEERSLRNRGARRARATGTGAWRAAARLSAGSRSADPNQYSWGENYAGSSGLMSSSPELCPTQRMRSGTVSVGPRVTPATGLSPGVPEESPRTAGHRLWGR